MGLTPEIPKLVNTQERNREAAERRLLCEEVVQGGVKVCPVDSAAAVVSHTLIMQLFVWVMDPVVGPWRAWLTRVTLALNSSNFSYVVLTTLTDFQSWPRISYPPQAVFCAERGKPNLRVCTMKRQQTRHGIQHFT